MISISHHSKTLLAPRSLQSHILGLKSVEPSVQALFLRLKDVESWPRHVSKKATILSTGHTKRLLFYHKAIVLPCLGLSCGHSFAWMISHVVVVCHVGLFVYIQRFQHVVLLPEVLQVASSHPGRLVRGEATFQDTSGTSWWSC